MLNPVPVSMYVVFVFLYSPPFRVDSPNSNKLLHKDGEHQTIERPLVGVLGRTPPTVVDEDGWGGVGKRRWNWTNVVTT